MEKKNNATIEEFYEALCDFFELINNEDEEIKNPNFEN